jgi:hypothetical protein
MFGKLPGEIVLWQGSKSELVPGFMGAHVPTACRRRSGAAATRRRSTSTPGGTHFYVADPEGALIQIGDQ